MSQTTLVTGGTGSFGRTIVRHLLDAGADEMRVLSRDETKQDDMRRAFADAPAAVLSSATSATSTASTRPPRGVDYVFHAAALKQVP